MRHNQILHYWLRSRSKPVKVYTDLEGFQTCGGTIPPSIYVTSQKPDLVIVEDTEISLVELTVSFDNIENLNEARTRKTLRYENLVTDSEQESGFKVHLVTVEVGARGFISKENTTSLVFVATKLGINKISNFTATTAKLALLGSRVIYNARNSPSW